jgi:hypothetical protein
VSSTASASRCAASTRWRRSTPASGSQRNAIVSCTRAQVCYVLDSCPRHYASDFLDSELFTDCCAILAQERPNALAEHPVAVYLNQWAVQRLKGLWEMLSTKWEKRYAEAL